MMTPVPIPFTRGRALSWAEKGHRLDEPAFFSLEMLTTLAWARATAFTTGVLRDSTPAPADVGRAAVKVAHTRPRSSRRDMGSGTLRPSSGVENHRRSPEGRVIASVIPDRASG